MRTAKAIARQYGLALVDDWPMPTLELHCFVVGVPADASAEVVLEQLGRDARVEWAQPVHLYRALGRNDRYYALQTAAQSSAPGRGARHRHRPPRARRGDRQRRRRAAPRPPRPACRCAELRRPRRPARRAAWNRRCRRHRGESRQRHRHRRSGARRHTDGAARLLGGGCKRRNLVQQLHAGQGRTIRAAPSGAGAELQSERTARRASGAAPRPRTRPGSHNRGRSRSRRRRCGLPRVARLGHPSGCTGCSRGHPGGAQGAAGSSRWPHRVQRARTDACCSRPGTISSPPLPGAGGDSCPGIPWPLPTSAV